MAAPLIHPRTSPAPACKCGCGSATSYDFKHARWHAYLPGHYRQDAQYKHRTYWTTEYVGKSRTLNDLAGECGVNLSTLVKAARKLGIPLRTQAESLAMSGAVAGPQNPAWRGGTSPERQRLYKQGHWRQFVQSIYARDGFRCQRCGAPKSGPRSLHAHHVKAWAENPALRFDPANVVTLCRTCHQWVHSPANLHGEFLA